MSSNWVFPISGLSFMIEEYLIRGVKMKITIIYDNTSFREDLLADWGFSCLVEDDEGHTILFDTGTNGAILLSNMEKLSIDPAQVDEIFISHAHFDHIGGLSMFLNKNSEVKIYCPESLRGVRGAKEVIKVAGDSVQMHENIYSTGELEQVEQSMAVKTLKGVVLVVGCSHPKMSGILDAAKRFGNIYAIIGGMHGFRDFDLFRGMELICPTHCTQYIKEIQSLYPDAYMQGGAGRIIEL